MINSTSFTTACVILKASKSPQLSQNAKSCCYVTYLNDGTIKHCIVGQVLADLGMDDETMIAGQCSDKNSSIITYREDLQAFMQIHDLNVRTLNEAQIAFDGKISFPQFLEQLRKDIAVVDPNDPEFGNLGGCNNCGVYPGDKCKDGCGCCRNDQTLENHPAQTQKGD